METFITPKDLKFKVLKYTKTEIIKRCEIFIETMLTRPLTITILSKETGKEIYKAEMEALPETKDILIAI